MTGSRFIHACSVAKSCPIHVSTNDPLLFLFTARKMALMNSFAVQEYRCRHREKTCGHREGRGRWDELGEQCWHLYMTKCKWRRKWQPSPVFLPTEPHGQRSLVGYSPRSCRAGYDWVTDTVTCVCTVASCGKLLCTTRSSAWGSVMT